MTEKQIYSNDMIYIHTYMFPKNRLEFIKIVKQTSTEKSKLVEAAKNASAH